MTKGSTLTATMLKSLSWDKEDYKVRVGKWLSKNAAASNPEALFKAMDDIVSDFKEVEKQVQSEVKSKTTAKARKDYDKRHYDAVPPEQKAFYSPNLSCCIPVKFYGAEFNASHDYLAEHPQGRYSVLS